MIHLQFLMYYYSYNFIYFLIFQKMFSLKYIISTHHILSVTTTILVICLIVIIHMPTPAQTHPMSPPDSNMPNRRYCSTALFEAIRVICEGRTNSLSNKYRKYFQIQLHLRYSAILFISFNFQPKVLVIIERAFCGVYCPMRMSYFVLHLVALYMNAVVDHAVIRSCMLTVQIRIKSFRVLRHHCHSLMIINFNNIYSL